MQRLWVRWQQEWCPHDLTVTDWETHDDPARGPVRFVRTECVQCGKILRDGIEGDGPST